MKAVLEAVAVTAEDGRPIRVAWKDRTWPVLAVRDGWEVGGRWWHGEPDREYWLLETNLGLLEVYRELGGEERWLLSRVQD